MNLLKTGRQPYRRTRRHHHRRSLLHRRPRDGRSAHDCAQSLACPVTSDFPRGTARPLVIASASRHHCPSSGQRSPCGTILSASRSGFRPWLRARQMGARLPVGTRSRSSSHAAGRHGAPRASARPTRRGAQPRGTRAGPQAKE
jgi:hypothetical protein